MELNLLLARIELSSVLDFCVGTHFEVVVIQHIKLISLTDLIILQIYLGERREF